MATAFAFFAIIAFLPLTAVAAAVCLTASRGRQPWLPLALVWLGISLPPYLARAEFTMHAAVSLLVPLLPFGVTALATDMEVRRGCTLWRAGSVAVLVGTAVAAFTPFAIYSAAELICIATTCRG